MTWGVEQSVCERFGAAGVPVDSITFARDVYTFNTSKSPTEFLADFRTYYGPTMNAYAAAEANSRADDLQQELEELFNSQNASPDPAETVIPATFLRVTVSL